MMQAQVSGNWDVPNWQAAALLIVMSLLMSLVIVLMADRENDDE